MNRSIGIIVNSNDVGGINKLSAMMANDIANDHTDVFIYVPIIPFYIYYVSIFNNLKYWLFKIFPFYLIKWLFKKNSSLDILDKSKISKKKINIKYYFYKIRNMDLKKHDKLILHGVGSVFECKNIYPQDKQIYLVNQIEEVNHGPQYEDLYKDIRKNFKGEVITHCNFMRKYLDNHVSKYRIIPNPISPKIWKFKENFDVKEARKDILFFWKNHKSAEYGFDLLDEIFKLNKEVSISIFARSTPNDKIIKTIATKYKANLFFDLSEQDVAGLYLSHSFLFYPNKFEDFGMPPVEGLACGCIPILRYGTGASDMYAINNFNSLFLTDNEKEDAYMISGFLKNNSKIYELRKNSHKNLDQFNPANYGERILNNK